MLINPTKIKTTIIEYHNHKRIADNESLYNYPMILHSNTLINRNNKSANEDSLQILECEVEI